jgi:ankyrin repeat protein
VRNADKDGFTPLHVTGHYGYAEVLRELLNHGANLNIADKRVLLHCTKQVRTGILRWCESC